MKKSLVSILICTYNAAKTIEATLQACLSQTHQNIEILIHDDQSIDNTLSIMQDIQDSRIKVLYSGKRLGPYGGLNFLLDHAQGEYIAIQDHDDLWHPEKLKKQVTFLIDHPDYIGCGTKTLMRYEGDSKGFEYYLGETNYYTTHPSLVFRSQGQKYPTNQGVYMLDALFQKTVLCKGKKLIYNINDTLTLHLIKDGASNFSYKRFTYSRATIKTIFALHPVRYGICIIGWETIRKMTYPVLQRIGKGKWIDIIERKPFEMMRNRTKLYDEVKIRDMEFNMN